MLIRRSLDKDGNLLPAAWNSIAAIPDSYLHHLAHGKRHPKSAYLTSLRLITEQWLKTLDVLDKLYNEHFWLGKESNYPELLAEYRELLYRINEHFDACFSVLRSLCDPDVSPATIFDSRYLSNAKFPGWKQFRETINPYRENHIGVLVNTLKHSQGELCPIFFYSTVQFRPGYYLRDILPDGALGPSPKLHENANTAFSFSRDMLLNLWWLYRTGDALAKTISGALQAMHGVQIQPQAKEDPDIQWNSLISRCARLRPEFFPDELKKPYPRILYESNSRSMSIEFPTTARGQKDCPTRVSASLTVDGAHPGNKFPYWTP